MRDSLCRLTVQHHGNDAVHAVDLALPRNVHVGQLMPSIVELVQVAGDAAVATRWRLLRVGGQPLDESMTLEQNHIDDGAVLMLATTPAPEPVSVVVDRCLVAAHATTTTEGPVLRLSPVVGCLLAAGAGAAALVWSAMVSSTSANLVTGAGVAAASALGAVVVRRAHPDRSLSVTPSVVAAMFAAATGFLAVPTGSAAAHVLLASAAAFSASVVLLRLTGCGTVCLTAIATTAMLTAAVGGVAVGWDLQVHVAGASLAAISLAALGIAPRLSIAATGIGPPAPSTDDPGSEDAVSERRVARAHQLLTGLVIGSSAAAALGAALVAFGGLTGHATRTGTGMFTAAIGLALLLRARTHTDGARRLAVTSGGMVSAAACFVIGVVSLPEHAHWISLLAVVAGIGVLSRLFGFSVNPVARRALEVAEYIALTGVAPLACWVAGVYELVRGMSLI